MAVLRIIVVVLLINSCFGSFQFSKYFDEYVSYLIETYPQNVTQSDEDIYTRLKNEGYNLEFHHVTTEDGYILGVHRIPRGRKSSSKKENRPPVILQHGLSCSSLVFLNAQPEKALGLVLADAGFDVWLTNNRGNMFSRNHTSLNPDKDTEFWNYSWEECGYYDIPAVIEYIHEKTRYRKVFYVGHSLGTTEFFAMGALRPAYNDRISLMTALAPVAYMQHMSSPIYKLAAEHMNVLQPIFQIFGIHEFMSHSNASAALLKHFCSNGSDYLEICSFMMQFICGFDPDQMDKTFFGSAAEFAPAGISVNMIIHYGQEINSGYFRRYDYGKKGNMKKYNSTVPPNYNVSYITAPIALYWSQNDLLAAVEDVERLIKQLPNLVSNHLMEDKYFTHCDYIIAKDVDTLVFNNLTALMKLYINDDDIDSSGDRIISSIFLFTVLSISVIVSYLY